MATREAKDLLELVLAAHGGRALWQRVAALHFDFSSGGLAFSSHLQGRALRGLGATVWPQARQVILTDFGGTGWQGHWTPDQVWLQDPSGQRVAEREGPRRQFARFDRNFRWDRLDILYFAGYALWNYLGFPFLLETPGVTLLDGRAPAGDTPGRLVVRFDASVPTHSALQTFHVDGRGHLLRHDYTADVIGRWARAANLCLESQEVEGLRVYTRRRVYPRLGVKRVLSFPLLVWIQLDHPRVEWGPA